MISKDLESLTALGRSLTTARDRHVISPAQFAATARALAIAMLTGGMEMDAYAGIHWVLGIMIEHAFKNPAGKKQDELGEHMETVGQMWNYVGPSGESLKAVDRFLERAFVMEEARFERAAGFIAPLRTNAEDFGRLLRASGILVISGGGPKIPNPVRAALTDPAKAEYKSHLIVGWGERRMAFVLS